MSTETEQFEDIDLEIDMSGAEVSRPILAEGTYAFDILGFKKETNKAGTGHNLIAYFATAVENKSTENKPIPAGYKLRQYISLVKKDDKYNPADKLAQLSVAAGQGIPTTFRTGPLVGKRIQMRIKVVKQGEAPPAGEPDTRPDQNEIQYYILPRDGKTPTEQVGTGTGSEQPAKQSVQGGLDA